MLKLRSVLAPAIVTLCLASGVCEANVLLQNATATYSQTGISGNWFVRNAIDGLYPTGLNSGWAIAQDGGFVTNPQTAAFETVTDIGSAAGTLLTFNLFHYFDFNNAQYGPHNSGRFRLSVTTDDRSTYADGLQTGGDVTANWTVLTPTSVSSSNGSTLTVLGDGSVLASGANNIPDVYTVQAISFLTGITGIRLEMLADDSLPDGGPGRATNGNFVLTELTLVASAVPEPSSIVLALSGVAGLALLRRRKLAV
jgi:hypothetical protein